MADDHSVCSMPPLGPTIVWGLLCVVMWFWAIVGPLYVVFGAASYFIDVSGFLNIPGWEALCLGGVLGAVGVGFVWLRVAGYIRFAPLSPNHGVAADRSP